MEVRVPNRLLSSALKDKAMKLLRIFIIAKLLGHRVRISTLLQLLKIHPKTGKRQIELMTEKGWIGCDGTFIFPRSWRRLNLRKRGGLYITELPKDLKRFEALVLAQSLKQLYRRKKSPRSNSGRAMPKDFSSRYLSKALGLSERRFKRLKSCAQRYHYLSSKRNFKRLGKASEYRELKKHLPGVPLFLKGDFTVTPELSTIKINI